MLHLPSGRERLPLGRDAFSRVDGAIRFLRHRLGELPRQLCRRWRVSTFASFIALPSTNSADCANSLSNRASILKSSLFVRIAASFAFGFANVIAASQSIRKCPVNVKDDTPGAWPSSLYAEAAREFANSTLATTDTSSNPPLPTDCSFGVGQQARQRHE